MGPAQGLDQGGQGRLYINITLMLYYYCINMYIIILNYILLYTIHVYYSFLCMYIVPAGVHPDRQ